MGKRDFIFRGWDTHHLEKATPPGDFEGEVGIHETEDRAFPRGRINGVYKGIGALAAQPSGVYT